MMHWRFAALSVATSAVLSGMTQQEAYQRYLKALGYIQSGPWVFSFDVQQ